MSLPVEEASWASIKISGKHLLGNDWMDTGDLRDFEIIRLTSLNAILSNILEMPESEIANLERLPFSEMSHSSMMAGIRTEDLIDDVRMALSSLTNAHKDVKYITHTLASQVFSRVHSICSHELSSLGRRTQKEIGAYYTPPSLARYIADATLNGHEIMPRPSHTDYAAPTVLDPACGTGSFLVAAFESIFKSNSILKDSSLSEVDAISIKQQLAENLYGVDIDKGALEVADISIRLLVGERSLPFQNRLLGKTIKQGNALISAWTTGELQSLEEYFGRPEDYSPFLWEKEFPLIFGADPSGFDAVLTNPPYERLKPNKAEFDRMSSEDEDTSKSEASYRSKVRRLKERIEFFRQSDNYEYSNIYSLDTYRLFIERSLQTLQKEGRFGFIVPSALAGDLASRKLRKHLLIGNEIESLDFFLETSQLFKDVSQAFCILTGQKGGRTSSVDLRFGMKTVSQLQRTKQNEMSLAEIEQIGGPSLVIPKVESAEWELLKKMHLHERVHDLKWLVNRRGELDLTLDKNFISDDGGSRLLRGSNIGRYVLKEERKSPMSYVDLKEFTENKASSKRISHINLTRLACQQVNNQHQKWRLKFSKIEPGNVLANSCNYFVLKKTEKTDIILDYLLGLLNSELMNWRFSVTSYNNHVSNRELDLLPIPTPFAPSSRQGIVRRIADIAGSIEAPQEDPIPQLEAFVFKLFDISQEAAHNLLKKRDLSDEQIEGILVYF